MTTHQAYRLVAAKDLVRRVGNNMDLLVLSERKRAIKWDRQVDKHQKRRIRTVQFGSQAIAVFGLIKLASILLKLLANV